MRLLVLAVLGVAGIVGQDPILPMRSVWDGVYSVAQAQRGNPLYQASCASCHGAELQGRTDVPPAPAWIRPGDLRRPGTPALKGETFASNWNDLALSALFERIRISMPQERPGSLSRQQNADILAFILQENGYPPGRDELPAIAEPLRQIRIVR